MLAAATRSAGNTGSAPSGGAGANPVTTAGGDRRRHEQHHGHGEDLQQSHATPPDGAVGGSIVPCPERTLPPKSPAGPSRKSLPAPNTGRMVPDSARSRFRATAGG